MSECRLCGGATQSRFRRLVLGRLDVEYRQCLRCASLQTEAPYWLQQAYPSNLASIDTGGAQRSLLNAAACFLLARVFGLRNVIDFGGGDGLLCRLLRDRGINAFVRDPHAVATYAQGFTQPDFTHPDLLTAFEVLEHFAEPRAQIADMLSTRPRFVLLSTQLYSGQDADWWYLVPETGQHVFFYSRRALQAAAQEHGYRARFGPNFILLALAQERAPIRLALLPPLLRGKVLKLVLGWMVLLPAADAWADLQRRRDGVRAAAPPGGTARTGSTGAGDG